jgi:hypothetical protein
LATGSATRPSRDGRRMKTVEGDLPVAIRAPILPLFAVT